MLPPFDIFRLESHGSVLWVKAMPDLISAKNDVLHLMASSPSEYLILSHLTNNKIVMRPPGAKKRNTKPVVFQVAYDPLLLASREELLKSSGFDVVSAFGNDAAMNALKSKGKYDLFLVGHAADTAAREEMAARIRAEFPGIPILALNPPTHQQLAGADYNLVINGHEEWLLVVETATAA